MSYDPKGDEFTVLTVFQHITVGRDGKSGFDLHSSFEHLQNLWLNRDHLILPPVETPFLSSPKAALRVSNTTYRLADLGSPGLSPPDNSPVPLDAIRIRPGGFFLEGNENLCSYHQVVVPGRILDSLLPLKVKQELNDVLLGKSLAAGIDTEIERRKSGGAISSWQQCTAVSIRQDPPGLPVAPGAEPATTQTAQPPDDQPSVPFDIESLILLRNAIAKQDIRVTRLGSVFTILVPLTPDDAAHAAACFGQLRDAWKSTAEDRFRKLREKHADLAAQIEAARTAWGSLEASTAAKAVGGGLDFSFDLVKWSEYSWHTDRLSQALSADGSHEDADVRKRAADMAALVSEHVPVDLDLNTGKIYAGFHAGTLPSRPSIKPVEPGLKLAKPDDDGMPATTRSTN